MNAQKPLLSRVSDPDCPSDLTKRVLAAVHLSRIREIWRRFFSFLIGLIASIAVVVVNWPLLREEWAASSFGAFLRLAISDPDIIFANAKDYSLGLLESLPAEAIALFVVCVFCLVGVVSLIGSLRKTSFISTHNMYV